MSSRSHDKVRQQAGAGSLENLRQSNRARILEALQERGAASRVELIEATGLARTTVSSLVGELLLEGVLVERNAVRRHPEGGRPAVQLSLDPASGAYAGIDFGHDGVRAVLVDRAGSRLAGGHLILDVDADAGAALEAAAKMTQQLLEHQDAARLLGAGSAISAPLDPTGRVASQRILRDWESVDVQTALEERLSVPVAVGNDANLGALAEVTFGAARGADHALYVMLSAGVGMGMVLHGGLYEGQTGTAGELGHVVVEPDGRVCRCGARGCLETIAGTSALLDSLRPTHGDLTVEQLLELVADGDPIASVAVRTAGQSVGATIAGICRVLDPGVVVVGGELAAAGSVLLGPIRAAFGEWERPPAVRIGALGPEAEALGAAAAAMRAGAALTGRAA